MTRPRTLFTTAAASTVVLLVAATTAAYGATGSVKDPRGDAPPHSDIVKARFTVADDYVAAKVSVEDLGRSGVVAISVALEGPDGPDARGVSTVKATKRPGQKPQVKVSYYSELGATMHCSAKVAWNARKDTVWFKATEKCLNEYMYVVGPRTHVWAKAWDLNGHGRDLTKEIVVQQG